MDLDNARTKDQQSAEGECAAHRPTVGAREARLQWLGCLLNWFVMPCRGCNVPRTEGSNHYTRFHSLIVTMDGWVYPSGSETGPTSERDRTVFVVS